METIKMFDTMEKRNSNMLICFKCLLETLELSASIYQTPVNYPWCIKKGC